MPVSETLAVVCAYCRFDEPCIAENILRSFIHQILAQRPKLLPLVWKCYSQHRFQRTEPTFDQIIEMFHSLVSSLAGVHIVVDGLDEITDDKEKVTLLRELEKLPARVLIFSRPLDLHIKHLPSATQSTIEAQGDDIESFVMTSLLDHPSFQQTTHLRDAIIRKIATGIRERSGGMCVFSHTDI